MKLYNSLTQSKQLFKPISNGQVTIYVCGITPYDVTHLGHAFTYISFDAVVRFLSFLGYKVIYTQNVTDINDRDQDLLKRAQEENIPWYKLADYWTKRFLKDMKALNWLPPKNYLKASQNIDKMIKFIQQLSNKGLAYQVGGSVYLDISKVKDYGKLSRLGRPQMLVLAKEFEEDLQNPDKKDPLDITLWRASTPNQPSHIPIFNSPFGSGRPGWHIECSTMSITSLGERIDIHGGGKDLIFPHHEAEIAQSESATGEIPFAKYWIHTGSVYYRAQKMSKSKGNLVLLSDLLKKYSANAIRWLLLSHHYRQSWEYRPADLIEAQKNVDTVENNLVFGRENNIKNQFISIMDHDMDTPGALQLLLYSRSNKIYQILGFRLEK